MGLFSLKYIINQLLLRTRWNGTASQAASHLPDTRCASYTRLVECPVVFRRGGLHMHTAQLSIPSSLTVKQMKPLFQLQELSRIYLLGTPGFKSVIIYIIQFISKFFSSIIYYFLCIALFLCFCYCLLNHSIWSPTLLTYSEE